MSGLLLEREQGIYSFAHLTFQEYFAATFMCERQQEAILIAHLGESWWEETARLYCAQTDATTIITTCLTAAPSSVPHMVLALECYEEAHLIQPTVKPQIDNLLEKGAEDTDITRRNVVAEVLLRRRLKEMVPVRDGVYRDTSLITHIEYQLFIGEQRTLKLHFQLDHWNNIQFPAGQALLPVVGVRPSDAEAFCQWLTQREAGVWKYRLPKLEEQRLKEVHLRPSWLPPSTWTQPLGYWEEKEHRFIWINQQIGSQPENPSSDQCILVAPLDLESNNKDDNADSVLLTGTTEMYSSFSLYVDLASVRASALARASVRDLDRADARDRARDREVALALARTLTLDLGFALNRALDLDLDLALNRALDLDLDLAFDRALDLDLARASALAHASASALAHAHALASASAHAHAHAHASALALDRTSALAHAHASASALDFALASASARALAHTHAFELAHELAHDLASASVEVLQLVRVETTTFLPTAKLLALLSICMSFSSYDLSNYVSNISFLGWWKHLLRFVFAKGKRSTSRPLTLNRRIALYQKIERLERRIQGKESPCEGILIVKEREETS